MRKSVYTICDQKAQSIGPLFVAVSDSEAERMVAIGTAKDELIRRYPADFALLRICDIDTATGDVQAPDMPCLVAKLDTIIGE